LIRTEDLNIQIVTAQYKQQEEMEKAEGMKKKAEQDA
jgi:hypothetical protein